jgi:IS30 family transposase
VPTHPEMASCYTADAAMHGPSSKEIARQLNASPQSVNSRLQRMLTKLGMPKSRRAAARLAAHHVASRPNDGCCSPRTNASDPIQTPVSM